MRHPEVAEQLPGNSYLRRKMMQLIEYYGELGFQAKSGDLRHNYSLFNLLQGAPAGQKTLAFVAEFSRGKTELINSLCFADTGLRLLPSAPGRTTMSPTELIWDKNGGSYIRLLDIETQLDYSSLADYKLQPKCWTQINLNCNSPSQMQEAFKSLIATKMVSKDKAYKLGLWNGRESPEQKNNRQEYIKIPCWRHALISLPHPLLQKGVCILDTPGLNALGCELELTLNILPVAQTIIFVLAADTGVTKTDLETWNSYVCSSQGRPRQNVAVVLNKIDLMWDDLADAQNPEIAIQNQIDKTASILNIARNQVFAVSAKQGLLAKVKNDSKLLERSGLKKLENFISKQMLN
jgi:hypothetical protein